MPVIIIGNHMDVIKPRLFPGDPCISFRIAEMRDGRRQIHVIAVKKTHLPGKRVAAYSEIFNAPVDIKRKHRGNPVALHENARLKPVIFYRADRIFHVADIF